MTEGPAELFGPAASELKLVEQGMRNSVAEDPPEVALPMSQLLEAGGKRIRPALVILSAMCGEYDRNHAALLAATAVETVHAATLVHDDVIDSAPTRRGKPTVAATVGDEPAIVIGDFYFAKAYGFASMTNVPEVVELLADAVMEICAGEVRQQSIRYRYSTTVDEYMQRIQAKTATLLAACCDIGALLGGLSTEHRAKLREYGLQLGIAFQIADDVLDYTATEGEVGKPIGHDIIDGFATLPLMLASIPLEDNRRLSEGDARQIVEAVRTSEGPRRALEEAQNHARAARSQLQSLPRSDAVDALAALTDYVVTRKL